MINYFDYFRKDGTQDRELIETLNRAYQQGRADAIEWHYFKDGIVPKDKNKPYLFCYEKYICNLVDFEGCEHFKENHCQCVDGHDCEHYSYYYEVNMGDKSSYSDGTEMAWCEIPLIKRN